MPRVHFTPNIQRHLACPSRDVAGRTVAEVLEAFFATHPPARGYVLDDQGAVRKHMVIFVDGVPIEDRQNLSDLVPETGEVFVMQALSGG
jgi:hypothetical protein